MNSLNLILVMAYLIGGSLLIGWILHWLLRHFGGPGNEK